MVTKAHLVTHEEAIAEQPIVEAAIEEVIDETSGKIYLPPCEIACPIGEPIQRTNVMIASLPPDAEQAYSQIIKIGDEIYDKNPLFTVCSYICGLCEKECNYKDQTGAIRRMMLKRFLTEYYLPHLEIKPPFPPPTKEKVAVIGGGPAGLMCAYVLSKNGYPVTIVERSSQLGGALRYIPPYRLPSNIVDITLNNLIRIANIEVIFRVNMGSGGGTLDDLREEGYQAIFVATGTPYPRSLTFEGKAVAGTDLEGVIFGLQILYGVDRSKLSPQLFKGKRVIVLGGGNVAFDVARSAQRLGGKVSVVCLESEDKSSKDGIPADVEEIEGSREEGIKITYCRGVEEIIGKGGKFKGIKCPRCTSVFDESGFNPKFDRSDVIYLKGNILLVTIGQGPERTLFQEESLLNERGRVDIDQLTLMSNHQEGVFIGGDVKRIGFAAEAMRDGIIAAESIDRYLKGEDLKVGREKEYEGAAIPKSVDYKPQPEPVWLPAEERLNFEPFERGLTLEEAIREARRCLHCGPCKSCKACVTLGLQPEIPEIEVNQDICSGCGICIAVCSYDANKLVITDKGLVSVVDDLKCKRCGVCVASCPAGARIIQDGLMENVTNTLAELSDITRDDVVPLGSSAVVQEPETNMRVVSRINEIIEEVTGLEVIDEVERILEEARDRITREHCADFWLEKTPCWEMCHCPDIIRNECPAHKYPFLPCWQIEGTYCKLDDRSANGLDTSICKLCRVYKRYGGNRPLQIKRFRWGIDTSVRTSREPARKEDTKS